MDSVPDLNGLGDFVRGRRRDLGLTQRELGNRIGWLQERVSLLERGRYGLPSLIILARLSDALERPLGEVLAALGYRELSPTVETGSSRCTVLLLTLERFLAIPNVSLSEVLGEACDVVARVMGADIVELYLHDPDSNHLEAAGCGTTPLAQQERELGIDRVELDRDSRVADVFTTGRAYATGEARDDPRAEVYRKAGIETFLAAPVVVAGSRIGVLLAGSRHINRFSDDEQSFFLAVTHWLGLVAHRARLIEASSSP